MSTTNELFLLRFSTADDSGIPRISPSQLSVVVHQLENIFSVVADPFKIYPEFIFAISPRRGSIEFGFSVRYIRTGGSKRTSRVRRGEATLKSKNIRFDFRDAVSVSAVAAAIWVVVFGELGAIDLPKRFKENAKSTEIQEIVDLLKDEAAADRETATAAKALLVEIRKLHGTRVEITAPDIGSCVLQEPSALRQPGMIARNSSGGRMPQHIYQVNRQGDPIRVELDGKVYQAFAALVKGMPGTVTVLWGSKAGLPVSGVPSPVEGDLVSNQAIVPLDDVPTDLEQSDAAYLVKRSARWDD